MKSYFKVNFGVLKNEDKINLCSNFIKRNKNKLKIIFNNKTALLESELNKKIKIKFLLLESNLFFYQSYQMKYNINEGDDKIRIFGSKFVENNYLKCMIIYKKEIFPLQEYFEIKATQNIKLKIKLLVFDHISDLSHMFDGCDFLEKFEFIKNNEKKEIKSVNNNNKIEANKNEKISENSDDKSIIDNTYNDYEITKVSNSKECKLYDIISTINNNYHDNSVTFDFKNVYNFHNNRQFSYQVFLNIFLKKIKITDILFKFKFINNSYDITNLSSMFEGCSSLISLSDISKFNINNIILY